MERKSGIFKRTSHFFMGLAVVCGLYVSSVYSYLLFHTLVELFSVLTAFVIFALAWHTRKINDNHYLLFIGIASFFTGALDLAHTLSYEGMGIFPYRGGNPATQFWVAFRFLFSVSFLLSTFFIEKKLRPGKTVILYALAAGALTAAIVLGWFPDCYIEGTGLSPFKIASEYVICLFLLAALILLIRKRSAFDPLVFRLLVLSLIFSIATEVSFTEYASVFGFANMLGHLFLLTSVALIYRAIVVTGVVEPSRLLFRTLKQSEEAIRVSENKYRLLFENMINAFAYHRIVTDDEGRPVDYIFLEANRAFETLTGLKRTDIVGKRVREVLPGIENDPADWISVYGAVALKGQEISFEQFAAPLGKWYSVSAYSPIKDHFVTVFEDITARKRTEAAFQKSLKQFELLARTAGELLQAPDPQRIVESLCRQVMEHLDCHAFFNYLVDEQAGRLRLNAWAGIREEEARKIEWLDFGSAVCGCAARDGCRIVAEKIPTTPDERTELVKSFGIKAYACHPILGPSGKVIGTLSFGTCSRVTFSEDELSLMKAVTDQVAVAMIRMKDEQALRLAHDELDQRVRERTAELARANRELEQEISVRTLAEKELRESEERFRTSVESMLGGYATFSAVRNDAGKITDFRYEYINAAGCRLNRRTREEQVGRTLLALLPAHRETELFDEYVRVVETGDPLAKSIVYEDAYGSGRRMKRAFDLQAVKLGDGFAVVWQDVSEQKQVEEALRLANSYNRSLLEASLDPLVTIAADGKITDVNLATEAVTGNSRMELIGTDFSDYFTDREKAMAGYQQVFREGSVKDYPLEIRHKDGRITPVLYNASVYRDKAGKVTGVFAAARDITERRESERRTTLTNQLLKLYTRKFSRKEYLDVAVELIREWTGCRHTGVRIANQDGKIPYESCSGYNPDFLDSEKELSLKDDHCICTRVVIGTPDPSELVSTTPNGSFYCNETLRFVGGLTDAERQQYRRVCMRHGFASLAVVPIRHTGMILGAIHVADERAGRVPLKKVEFIEQLAFIIGEALFRFRIEEELRELNKDLELRVTERTAQLESANRELEAFAYSVSHDLRAPLRSIDGFSHAILEDYGHRFDDSAKDYFQRIRAAAGKMGRLIDALLNLSRLTRGEVRRTSLDLTSLATAVANELRKSEPERTVEFRIAEGMIVQADPVMLRAVIENLISNSWKFTGKRPAARIEFGNIQKDGKTAYFVRDNGAGFDMAYANKLFTAFQRLHGTEDFPGLGIGLATVQRIVHRHGGRIWAEGEVDKGATVFFTLS